MLRKLFQFFFFCFSIFLLLLFFYIIKQSLSSPRDTQQCQELVSPEHGSRITHLNCVWVCTIKIPHAEDGTTKTDSKTQMGVGSG